MTATPREVHTVSIGVARTVYIDTGLGNLPLHSRQGCLLFAAQGHDGSHFQQSWGAHGLLGHELEPVCDDRMPGTGCAHGKKGKLKNQKRATEDAGSINRGQSMDTCLSMAWATRGVLRRTNAMASGGERDTKRWQIQ